MLRQQTVICAALLMGLSISSFAQVPAPANASAGPALALSAPPKPGKHGPAGPPAPRRESLQSLTTVSGTVQQLTGNDDAILNGFTLTTSAGTTAVRFPANMGQSISNAVKTGSSATVTGYMDTAPTGEHTFHLVKLQAGKTTLTETPPTPPATTSTPATKTITGKVADYQLNREGKVKGLVMADQTILKVPPHVADQLSTMVPKGSTITAEGFEQSLGDGQVQLQKRTIFRPSVLTINGQSFLVR